MSLRLRLTLLYAALTGGILLVFAAAVIFVFNAILVDQIDNTLANAVEIIVKGIKVNSLGEVSADLSTVEISSDVYVQVCGVDNKLQTGLRTLEGFAEKPFDESAFILEMPLYHYVQAENQRLRVVSVPLKRNDLQVATLQVAVSLDVVDTARIGLARILGVIWVVAILL